MNIVRQLRESAGMQQKEVAIAVGVSRPTVSEWEHQKKDPSGARLLSLARLFGVDAGTILGYRPVGEPKPHDGYISVPIYGTIPAGIPLNAIQDIIDYEELSTAVFSPDHEYFALRIKGDSMAPQYQNGDTVIFKKQNDCENGDDCAVMVNSDDATFKRIKKSESGIALMPLNPDFDMRFYTNEQIESIPVTVLGVAVEIRRSLRK